MFRKLSIFDGKHVTILTSMFLLAVAVFVVVSYARPALSEEIAGGTVLAVDAQSGFLTVRTADRGEFTVGLDKDTSFWMCDGYKSLSDIKIGDKVDISYYDNGIRLVAGSITGHDSMRAC